MRSCYLDLTPKSCNLFTRKCVAVREENLQSDLIEAVKELNILKEIHLSTDV